ncbi:hypothetical protein VE03_05485 [Pseudogymnoascus sp. 23342-1-I1]|nr:hypothetical protein VE03_05485 [Pseudogymnoascus sp. 23342-1-I1]
MATPAAESPSPLDEDVLSYNATPRGSTAVHSIASKESIRGGTWGEDDDQKAVSRHGAIEDLSEMRKELSKLESHKRSQSAAGKRKKLGDDEADIAAAEADDAEDFQLDRFLLGGQLERRTTAGDAGKKVGVVFKNMTVVGVNSSATFVKTLPDAVLGSLGPDLYRHASNLIPALKFGKAPPTRNLIHDFTGAVRDGEMMLVLGRPGSGCSTFLKTIANERSSFVAVDGDVTYGGISADVQHKLYRGEVNYNPEDDQHFPSLNVWQTLKFALMNKTKKQDQDSIPIVANALMKMFGISHTKKTLVGDAFSRGVSGGERKRVGIAETLATKSTVVCWDNSTRGLDASTALDYAKSLRVMTDVSNRTTFVTLYQAGEGIYDLMDKVLVIEEGRMLYQGPATEAKEYFENLGFLCSPGETTSDFLTSLCDPNARRFQPGREASTPKSAEDLEAVFRASDSYKRLLQDVSGYESRIQETDNADTRRFQQTVSQSKSKHVSKESSYTVSFYRQVIACTKREFWLTLGDKTSLYTKFFVIIANALIVGSLFYGQPLETSGAFSRSGVLFFSIVFPGWLQLTELMKAVSGRVVIARHKDYAFYRPSAVSIARAVVDIPLILSQVVVFAVITYFLSSMDMVASKFFIYILFVYVTTLCLTAMYRMFAAVSPSIDDAVRFAGVALNLLVIFVGYVIPKPLLVNKYIWFGWIYYVNPISYAYEAVITNEFAGRDMVCSDSMLVPQGPGVSREFQGCTLPGSEIGSTTVSGSSYLTASFGYSREHLWRNFGVVIAFTVLYTLITAVAAEKISFAGGGGGALSFKKTRKAKQLVSEKTPVDDVEGGSQPTAVVEALTTHEGEKSAEALTNSDRVFTWSNVEYTVPYDGGEKKLLNGISGYVKPGVMVALMGASGAGKTTLLNTLAQRQTVGVISGDMLVDGRALGPDFQRSTGFCEQMDLHDGTATIRESLEFSAILRQDRNVPREEKIAYVNQIISLLELEDIQDAIVSSLGVEQRKRLTIGVELAAKPSLLLFLDEPTSGLDSQSAYSIVRFLKKLSLAGQAIICTIHQPSSMLINQFDMILALNPGGNTFYFGPVGEGGSAVVKYFAERGFVCPPSKNVAEFILETAAKRGYRDGKVVDWNEEWRSSSNNRELALEIERINKARSELPAPALGTQYEFAAPVMLQTTMLTKRLFTQYWRDSSYIYSKIFVSFVIGIFNGFTFWKLGNTVGDMQNRMFSVFLIVLLPPIMMNSIIPKFYINRSLWEARELPSRIYGWIAFSTASILGEIPAAILTSTIYWLCWYYPTGLPTDSSSAGYMYLMSMLFYLFQMSWGQWVTAFAPSFTVISNVLPFFLVMVFFFNGVFIPYASFPVFWRYWMYYVNPVTYWIRGSLAGTVSSAVVVCSSVELSHFNPPPNQTCRDYAGDFVSKIAQSGYLGNPDATSDCTYCAYSSGAEYLRTLNVQPDDKWKCMGIFLAFCIINWALVYFFIYTTRIRGWSFGLGFVIGSISSVIGAIKGGIMSLLKGGKKSEA